MTVFSFVVTALGLVFLAAFFEGALMERASVPMRLIFLALAAALIWPDIWVSLVGLIASIPMLVVLALKDKKKQNIPA